MHPIFSTRSIFSGFHENQCSKNHAQTTFLRDCQFLKTIDQKIERLIETRQIRKTNIEHTRSKSSRFDQNHHQSKIHDNI